ncbi:MAG: dockerin, partial [Phycisphaerae bacterium]|nr:dockerin [Phycisphaerae bacterium]
SGDVNDDGAVDGEDIAAFLDVIFNNPSGPPSESFCAADLDGNGEVNLDDVQPFVEELLGL